MFCTWMPDSRSWAWNHQRRQNENVQSYLRSLALAGSTRNRFTLRFTAACLLSQRSCYSQLFASAKSQPSAPSQEKQKKPAELHWDPPQVDDPVPFLSTTPPCPLSRRPETSRRTAPPNSLIYLQNFDAHEHLRFEQTDRLGMSEMFITENFDYLVDFGEQSGPLKVQETRTPLAGSDNAHLSTIVDKGLPVLALIFYPVMQGDYEMRCEGSHPVE